MKYTEPIVFSLVRYQYTETKASFMISVLLIDDDPDLLEIISFKLGFDGDLAIQTCNSPQDAIEITRNKQFDSIVCDFSMPGMDGCSLFKLLRSRGCTAQLILFSAIGQDDEITHALTHGMDFYVRREGNPEAEFRELKEIIRTAWTERKQHAL